MAASAETAARSAPLPVRLSFEPITRRATHLCSTLALEDLNVDHRGRVTFCCQLSSLYRSPEPGSVVVGELGELGFAGAAGAQARRVASFLEAKIRAWRHGPPLSSDVHPCQYCLRVFEQRATQGVSHAA